jgi:preprotein translocase subunit SecE
MAKDEELEKAHDAKEEEEGSEESDSDPATSDDAAEEKEAGSEQEAEREDATEKQQEEQHDVAPTQLGHKRFVYAAYLAGGILVAFISTKLVDLAWTRLGQWKPEFGEPKDEITAPLSAVIGAIVALKYWRDQKVRKLAEEVAEELTKVTWPTRKEVTSSTAVVIVATMFATVFFFLMDKFWSFVTNLVYGS